MHLPKMLIHCEKHKNNINIQKMTFFLNWKKKKGKKSTADHPTAILNLQGSNHISVSCSQHLNKKVL